MEYLLQAFYGADAQYQLWNERTHADANVRAIFNFDGRTEPERTVPGAGS